MGIASVLHDENSSGGWLHNKMNVHLKMVKMVTFHFLYILPHKKRDFKIFQCAVTDF